MEPRETGRFRAAYARLCQYRLRSLLLLVAAAAVVCWWLRPEHDRIGAIVAVHATVIERRVEIDPNLVFHTSLDDSALNRLHNRLARKDIVVRGIREARDRILGPHVYYDKKTGRTAENISVTIEHIKVGRVTGMVEYGNGQNGAGGTFICRKRWGTWVVELTNSTAVDRTVRLKVNGTVCMSDRHPACTM